MPTYEYACRSCGEHLEVVQSFKDDPLTVCPSCQGELRKVFSAAGIIFKGSGWHIKDYGTSNSGPSSTSGTGSSSGTESTAKDTGTKESGNTSSGDEKSA